MKLTRLPSLLAGERPVAVHPAFAPFVDAAWQRRLNLYPGRTLTAQALDAEQTHRAARLALLGQALSAGVVQGLECTIESEITVVDGTPQTTYFARIAPGFVMHFQPVALVFALALALAWLYVVFYTSFSPMRSVTRWACGVVLLWGTFAMLWLPWVDYQKSYRLVAAALKARVPAGTKCIADRALGISQAAALDYRAGIRTQSFDPLRPTTCPVVLVQGTPGNENDAPPAVSGRRWVKIADVGRPGDRTERYRLYRLER